MEELKSLKEIAENLRKKADEIGETYFLDAIKLIQASDILDPPKET